MPISGDGGTLSTEFMSVSSSSMMDDCLDDMPDSAKEIWLVASCPRSYAFHVLPEPGEEVMSGSLDDMSLVCLRMQATWPIGLDAVVYTGSYETAFPAKQKRNICYHGTYNLSNILGVQADLLNK